MSDFTKVPQARGWTNDSAPYLEAENLTYYDEWVEELDARTKDNRAIATIAQSAASSASASATLAAAELTKVQNAGTSALTSIETKKTDAIQELDEEADDVTRAAKQTIEGYVEETKDARDDAISAKDQAESAKSDAESARDAAYTSATSAAASAASASGANVVDYDATTSTLSIKRDSTVLDTTTIVAGGGTTVSVDAIETTGTHIADITVDGTKTELYAPEGGSDVDIVTSWETSPSDEKVPSEKLVKESLESLNDDLVELDNSILTHNISVNRFVLPNYESGKVIDLDGSINTSSTKGRCTDYIEVDSSVPYSVYCFDSAWNNGYNCIWSVVEYDSDKNRIAGTQIAKASYTLQSNTKYIRVSNFDATNGGIRWVNGLVVCKTSELPNSYVKGFEDWSYIDDTKIMSDVDNKQITLWGDSLTMGNTDTSIISNASNMIVNRCGGGSESSTALAVRMGAIDCNVLPFNIGQNVDAIEISIKTYGIRGGVNVGALMRLNVGGINPVYINGIKGNLSRSDNKIYFTRETSGEYIQITRPTKLFTNSEMTRLNDIAVIWIGTNDGVNTNNLQYTTDLIFDMIDSLKAKEKKYIVMGLHQCITQSQIESINNRFSELFGKHFLNYYDYLMNYGLADQDKTATSQDEQDIADKRIPTSLRSDFTHFTTATYTYSINPLIVKKLKDLGYIN